MSTFSELTWLKRVFRLHDAKRSASAKVWCYRHVQPGIVDQRTTASRHHDDPRQIHRRGVGYQSGLAPAPIQLRGRWRSSLNAFKGCWKRCTFLPKVHSCRCPHSAIGQIATSEKAKARRWALGL